MRQLLAAGTAPDDTALRFDLTELAGLDFLSSPTGVIREAQQLAAAAFGADHTWFLVNGCSGGIHAAVMAAVKPGQHLLLARNCHLSAFAACVQADCQPLWLQPQQDPNHGIAHCITPAELQRGFAAAAEQGVNVAAVLVVSPTYYGAVARLQELASICHERGVPLLVDAAHGAHMDTPAARLAATQPPASSDSDSSDPACHNSSSVGSSSSSSSSSSIECLPMGALAAGADVVIHSSHKVLTAMTQAAMLHCQGARVSPARISKALQVLQTSSPSYLLMASLDAARQHAVDPASWQQPLAAAAAARAAARRLPGLVLVEDSSCSESVAGFDPLRLVLDVQHLGMSGFAAAEWLEQRHSIVPELATAQLVVFVFGPGSKMADAAALSQALQHLSSHTPPQQANTSRTQRAGSGTTPTGATDPRPATVLPPRAAFFAATEVVPLQQAVGRVSAELLCPYPPGVPVVFPGERITTHVVELLRATLAHGGVVTGGSDSTLQTAVVVAGLCC